jgi:transposase
MTAWRRLEQWTRAGVFDKLQRALLDALGQQGQVDFSRASIDSSSVRASKGGAHTGKNPTDRAKAGSKHHLLVDRKGLPLAESLTGANVHDTHELSPLLDAIPDVKQPRGRPRHRPAKLHADKAYASRKNRRELRRRGIAARIARPGIESKQRLGRHRWVVELSRPRAPDSRNHEPPRPGDCASGLELPSSWPRWQRPAGSDPNMHRVPPGAHPSADGSVAERLLDRTQVAMQSLDLTSSGPPHGSPNGVCAPS